MRLEGIRKRWRDALRAEMLKMGNEVKIEGDGIAARWEVLKMIKRARRVIGRTHNVWAMELGFANYQRMYRACLAAYRKTPGQLELELIGELLREASGEALPPDEPARTVEELDREWKERQGKAEMAGSLRT